MNYIIAIISILSLLGCRKYECNSLDILTENLNRSNIQRHCNYVNAPIHLSDATKNMIFDFEKNKNTMSLNSFKSNFEEIFTENKEIWNPTDALEQGDPTNLILGMISTSNAIGIEYIVGGIRCCDTIFQVYKIVDNKITEDKIVLLE